MSEPTRHPISPEDILKIRTVRDVQLAPDGERVAYVLQAIDAATDEYRSTIWTVAAGGGAPRPFTRSTKRDTAPSWSPDGTLLAFLSDRDGDKPQLYVMPADGGEARRLTSLDGGAGPAVWSPDGTTLLFAARVSHDPPPTDTDARKRWESRPRPVTRAHYKDDGAGFTFAGASQVFTVAIDGGEPRQLTEGRTDNRTPAWSPDGAQIAFVRTRTGAADYNITDVWTMRADGSDARRLTDAVGRATCPTWSPDGQTLACYGTDEQRRAMGADTMRIWLVPVSGAPPRSLTAGYDRSVFQSPWTTPAGPSWSADGTVLLAPFADAGNVHLMEVNTNSGSIRPIIAGERQVLGVSAPARSGRIALIMSEILNPADVFITGRDGFGERRLTRVNEDGFASLDLPRVERRTFAGPNGMPIEGWLTLPPEQHSPAPLLLQIHGGPHSFAGNVFPSSAFYSYVLAARGWATLALNPSGSGSYGTAFQRSLLARWGEYDLPEHHAAIDALVTEGIADPNRLAVTGYSYGGYMTSWVVGHTDRFKAAVIGAPVTNLESFHGTSDIGIWFSEGEMLGDIQTTRDTYRRLSPITYVDQVTSPCLILHGESDDRCPIGQGEEFFAGLVAVGRVPVEFVRYPGGSHSFVGMGRPSHRLDYVRRLVAWVEAHTLAVAHRPEAAIATGD